MHISSAYIFETVGLKACGMPLMYIKKRRRPRTEPCRTQHVIKPSSKKSPSSNTKNFLFER